MAGGAEVHLHEILRRAVAAGHEVDWVSSGWAGAPAVEVVDGIAVHRAGDWRLANFILPGVVRRLLRERAYDLLVEDINKIPFYTPLYAGRVPVVAVVPHLFGATVFRETGLLQAAYVWAAEQPLRLFYRRVDFEVISPSTRDDLITRGFAPARIHTILCGLDHARFHLPDAPPRDPDPLLVTWSRLRRYKSLDVALRAFRIVRDAVPSARLVVMGRGPDAARLRRLAASLGLAESVAFPGWQPQEQLVRTLYRSRVCLNPSPKEGWGLTVVEANACGLPVVASARPGLRDSVLDGQTGFLVPYGDAAAFADAALRLIREPELWRAQSEAARSWAASFSWERCAAESLALFSAVAARGRGSAATAAAAGARTDAAAGARADAAAATRKGGGG